MFPAPDVRLAAVRVAGAAVLAQGPLLFPAGCHLGCRGRTGSGILTAAVVCVSACESGP